MRSNRIAGASVLSAYRLTASTTPLQATVVPSNKTVLSFRRFATVFKGSCRVKINRARQPGATRPTGSAKCQGRCARGRCALQNCHRRQTGLFHVTQFVEQTDSVWHTTRTSITSRQHRDSHRMGQPEHPSMAVDDSLEMSDHVGIPAKFVGMIDLRLHGGKRRHPGNLSVAHAGELLGSDEKAVLDRGDAALDRVLDARRAGRVGESLSPVLGRCRDNRGDLARRHLGRQS